MLSWSCTQGAAWVQSVMFGVSGSTLSDWLRFDQQCLNIVLYDSEHAKIDMGSDGKIRLWKEEIAAKYPDLDMCILLLMGLSYDYKSQVMTESRTTFTMVGQAIIK